MKCIFDIVSSGLGLVALSPLFAVLAIWIKADSKGPVFYRQVRVGKDNRDFRLFKFRSMRPDSDKVGSLKCEKKVMPDKLAIDLEYVAKANLWNDIKLIFSTFKEIIMK